MKTVMESNQILMHLSGLQKDSVMWVSISATFLSIEAFRIFITPDTIIILNKLDKTVEYHPFQLY